MRFSKATATKLGTMFAEKMHACEAIEAREGVLSAFYGVQDALATEAYPTYRALTDAFRNRINELEPLERIAK